MEFFCQDTAQFVEQRSRGNHDVVADRVLQQLIAGPACHERGDQHICVQQEPHDTRVNTSSSVNTPCACAAAIMRSRSWRNRRTNRKSSKDWRSTLLREIPSSLAALSRSRRTARGKLIVTVSLIVY